MDEPSSDLQRRGLLGVLLLVVPVVSIVAVAIAYVVMFSYGTAGREATGPRVRVAFRGCEEAAPIVLDRIAAMGLPDAEEASSPGGFAVLARLPEDPAAREHIPATLAQRGELQVREGDDGQVLLTEADIAAAEVSMRFLDAPYARVVLAPEAAKALETHQKAHMDGHVAVWLDGRRVARIGNMPAVEDGELVLDVREASDVDRIAFAASTAIVLADGPLPCDLEVASVEDAP